MLEILAKLLPFALLGVVIRVMMTPIRWGWKLLIHGLCGFACLWLLNIISPYTGLVFPINLVTVLTAGILGIPGIGVLALLQFL